jgi:hypothetical protein
MKTVLCAAIFIAIAAAHALAQLPPPRSGAAGMEQIVLQEAMKRCQAHRVRGTYGAPWQHCAEVEAKWHASFASSASPPSSADAADNALMARALRKTQTPPPGKVVAVPIRAPAPSTAGRNAGAPRATPPDRRYDPERYLIAPGKKPY